ncbi:MAG TPA: hypothetical protein EYG73_10645 [Arcobacter sp.]|nr:hypothetical protein [Arcobacter sp.]
MKKIFAILLLSSSFSTAYTDSALLGIIASNSIQIRINTKATKEILRAHLEMIKKLNHKQLKVQARMLVEIQKQNSILQRLLEKE